MTMFDDDFVPFDVDEQDEHEDVLNKFYKDGSTDIQNVDTISANYLLGRIKRNKKDKSR